MGEFGSATTTDEVLGGVDLTGRRVLITGAAVGLGRETARAMAAHGADVTILARTAERAAEGDAEGETKRKGPRYTPLSKRQERPAAIAWLVKFHPELSDGAISKLVGTTKPTIESIRDRTHWKIANIVPVDPVALGMCKQVELDATVAKAVAKAAAQPGAIMTDDERMRLVSTEQSLHMEPEPRPHPAMSGLESFGLVDDDRPASEDVRAEADRLFNLDPRDQDDDEE